MTEEYYVGTVGLNEATIKKYIQEQEKHDIALNKLSVKEYKDLFMGYMAATVLVPIVVFKQIKRAK